MDDSSRDGEPQALVFAWFAIGLCALLVFSGVVQAHEDEWTLLVLGSIIAVASLHNLYLEVARHRADRGKAERP
jgi:hypothetical protein